MREVRARLIRRAFKVLQSPEVLRRLEDHDLLGVAVDVASLVAHARARVGRMGRAVARALGVATVEDLRRLEIDLARLRHDRGNGGGVNAGRSLPS